MLGPLETRYRFAGRVDSPDPASRPDNAGSRLYRGVLSATLFSRCRMFPNDSIHFDASVAACGPAVAVARAASRLFVEVAANPLFFQATMLEGRVRWIDLPPADSCSP
jgi:hypothetical protein